MRKKTRYICMRGGTGPDSSVKSDLEPISHSSLAQQTGPGTHSTGEGATVYLYSGQPDTGLVGEVEIGAITREKRESMTSGLD